MRIIKRIFSLAATAGVLLHMTALPSKVSAASQRSEAPRQNVPSSSGEASKRLVLRQTVILPNVRGGFDLMAIDISRGRLMLNAEDNDTTEIIDIKGSGTALLSIGGMRHPKWVAYPPPHQVIFISNGDGTLHVLRSADYGPIDQLQLGMPANNLRFDQDSGSLVVGIGGNAGAIVVLDANTRVVRKRIALDAFPKQFEIDGDTLYANIPDKRIVQVVNRKSGLTIARWPVCQSANVPMALLRTTHQLFIGCKDGNLVEFDSASGREVAHIAIGKDPDGISPDPQNRLIYVTSGEGFVDVISIADRKSLRLVERLATRPGAGTSLFVPALHRLFVPLPQNSEQPAELRSYETPRVKFPRPRAKSHAGT